MPRALIFGMYHHLVDLYQVRSNFIPGAKNGPAPVVNCFTYAYIGKKNIGNKSTCLKPQDLDYQYLVCSITL